MSNMWIGIIFFLCHYQIFIHSLELKSINSCQIPLLKTAKILPSSSKFISNTWCPSSSDSEPSLLISLPNITYMTRLSTQSSNFYYHLDYTREYSIDSKTIWRSYRLLTTSEENLVLEPPMIARHIRIHLKPIRSNVCLQLELFGCVFTDGVISYNMLQGSHQLEDEIYDGQYNEKHRYLYDGLGQLSDGQTGPDNYEDARGFQWIGWRKPRLSKSNYSIGILFNFDQLRNFSRLTIHTNNYFPKKILAFRSITIEFFTTNTTSSLTYEHQRDEQFEMARPIMIDLKYHLASQLKIHLFFDSSWILISEFTFDSMIVPFSPSISQSSSIDYPIYLMICLSIMLIILLFPILLIMLVRNLIKLRKPAFSPINSSISTTSSELDTNSSHHRYATVRSSSYTKLIPIANPIRRLSSMKKDHHIEGICGNHAYGSPRTFTFNFNKNFFISKERIHLKQRIINRHQLVGGGEIYQGELEINQSLIPITIRRLLPNISIQTKISFANEMSLLISLCHPHILHAYGFCSELNFSLITESSDMTSMDLYQYLQRYKQQPRETLVYSTVLFFAGQICSALAYLESLEISHRDIAARNCLISSNLHLKLHDLAMCNEIYVDDYVVLTTEDQIQTRRPIRWCAWETISMNRFTSKSDVFSFGVLLWEILTLADRPHRLLNDEQVLQNLRHGTHDLVIPSYAGDLQEIICSCWNRYESARPSFAELNQFFNQKQQVLTISAENNYQQVII